jgi:hypothetical protein
LMGGGARLINIHVALPFALTSQFNCYWCLI